MFAITLNNLGQLFLEWFTEYVVCVRVNSYCLAARFQLVLASLELGVIHAGQLTARTVNYGEGVAPAVLPLNNSFFFTF